MTAHLQQKFPANVGKAIDNFHGYVLREQARGSRSWGTARLYVERVAEELHRVIGSREPCIDLQSAAILLGVRIEVDPEVLNMGCAALVHTHGGLVAKIPGATWPQLTSRERFSIAHELGHSLFYTRESLPVRRFTAVGVLRSSHEARREEGLCNAFASALLLSPKFVEDLGNKDPSLGAAVAASRLANVSVEVVLRALLHRHNGWADSVFYVVHCDRSCVSARVLRGSNRRVADSYSPSAKVLGQALAPLANREISSQEISGNVRKIQPFQTAEIRVWKHTTDHSDWGALMRV